MNQITWLSHNRIRLALHQLREGDGRPLLLLHGLGESSDQIFSAPLPNWPGPVVGLDFTGHGRSTVPAGGGYTTEILLGDADAAVEVGSIGPPDSPGPSSMIAPMTRSGRAPASSKAT